MNQKQYKKSNLKLKYVFTFRLAGGKGSGQPLTISQVNIYLCINIKFISVC